MVRWRRHKSRHRRRHKSVAKIVHTSVSVLCLPASNLFFSLLDTLKLVIYTLPCVSICLRTLYFLCGGCWDGWGREFLRWHLTFPGPTKNDPLNWFS